MLRTASREVYPGISVVAHEPSNSDFYATQQLFKRMLLLYPEADYTFKELIGRFILMHTRTASVEGYIFMTVAPVNSDETLTEAMNVFMELPKAMTESWALLAAELDDPMPMMVNDGKRVPDPK